MKRAEPGFTLLELMVVLAIAGVLMAVGIPAMSDFIRNSRITAAANDVMAALHFTRSEAIKRRVPVTLCTSSNTINADGTPNLDATCDASDQLTGWIVFVDSMPVNDPDGVRDPAELLLLQRERMNPLITAQSSLDEFAVTYLMNGFGSVPNPAQIVLCDERGNTPSGGELSSARGIQVSVTGRAGVTRDMGEIEALGGCDAI